MLILERFANNHSNTLSAAAKIGTAVVDLFQSVFQFWLRLLALYNNPSIHRQPQEDPVPAQQATP